MNAGTTADQLIELIVEEANGFDHIGRTIIARRIIGVLSGMVTKEKIDPVGLVPFTDQQALSFGKTLMRFGKYQGEPINSVSKDYLEWLADQSRETWRDLHRYLNSSVIRSEDDDETR